MSKSRALFYAAPRRADIREVDVGLMTEGGAPRATVETEWSGISRGTERLVFEGNVPESEWSRMRAPFQEGAFSFPVKYGYAAAGRVVAGGRELLGRRVFCLHPHQTAFTVPASALTPIPDAVSSKRAVLAANMETALNCVWDAGVTAGDTVAIVGAGAVGLLILSVASAFPGARVTVADVDASRKGIVEHLGGSFIAPGALKGLDADVVFHTSATEGGLAAAISAAGVEATVLEASWYGDRPVSAPLGCVFHSKRLRLISSQVGMVSAMRRARWDYSRRLSMALSLLADDRLDALITHEVPFEMLPDALPSILEPQSPGIVTAIRYGGRDA
jgi:2-desacetyl-2-hydroxyethyl bacteriochlorophyllide A dehydrogenase